MSGTCDSTQAESANVAATAAAIFILRRHDTI
jgi:hypothetical protein